MSLSGDLRLELLAGFRLRAGGIAVPLSPGSQRLLAFLALRDAPVDPRSRRRAALAGGRRVRAHGTCAPHSPVSGRCATARRSAGAELALVDGLEVDVRAGRRLAAALDDSAPAPTMPPLLARELPARLVRGMSVSDEGRGMARGSPARARDARR